MKCITLLIFLLTLIGCDNISEQPRYTAIGTIRDVHEMQAVTDIIMEGDNKTLFSLRVDTWHSSSPPLWKGLRCNITYRFDGGLAVIEKIERIGEQEERR